MFVARDAALNRNLGFGQANGDTASLFESFQRAVVKPIRLLATALQVAPAAVPVVTSVPKNPLNHVRIGDIRRRPPAMTRNRPPQC